MSRSLITRFYLVRHGPTHAKTMIGWSDLEADLSDQGTLDRLSAYLPKTAVMISSDLRRAVATADCLQGPNHMRLAHDPNLRELHFGAILGMVQYALSCSVQTVFAHKIDNLSATVISFNQENWSLEQINLCP